MSQEEEKAQHDRIVQQTDQDAGVSRLSAVESGYLDDPYAHMFTTVGPQRRFPIINRGGQSLSAKTLKSIDSRTRYLCANQGY